MAARSIFSLKAAHRFVSSQELRGWSYSVGRRSVLACASVTRADRGSQPCERRGIYGSAIAPAPCSAGVDAQLFAGVCKRCVLGLPFESSGSFGRDSFTHAPSFLCEAALAMSWSRQRIICTPGPGGRRRRPWCPALRRGRAGTCYFGLFHSRSARSASHSYRRGSGSSRPAPGPPPRLYMPADLCSGGSIAPTSMGFSEPGAGAVFCRRLDCSGP